MVFTTRALLSLASLAIVVTPALAQFNFKCFATGAAFDCSGFIPDFCSLIGTTSFNGGDTAVRCFNGPAAGQQCQLSTLNNVSTVGTPSVTNCEIGLTEITDACPMGGFGQFTTGTFEFAIDPNTGACTIPSGN
ncbi:hypothetical protein DFH07DRAFT_1003585 [Mycena maculata]|uniref:Glycan binding protein Y3-like domain-containing protein n=1 Tax=Mycena maculata TaxID=230809 RepID=A0AAD7MNE9_9AGAR|nr:hypothetical protein DFH07DRAFT_1003585 [Mycena maculata]